MNWGISLQLSANYSQNMVLAINSKQHCNANAASVPLGRGYVSSDVRTQHLAVAYGYISAEAEESQSNQLLSQHALRCSVTINR